MANDGGLYRLPAGGFWDAFLLSGAHEQNNLASTQFYSIALHPSDPSVVAGGTQDNGLTIRRGNQWTGVFGGDVTRTLFDRDGNLYWLEGYGAKIVRSDDGGLTYSTNKTAGIAAEDLRGGGFQPPLLLHPTAAATLYYAPKKVYRSTDRGESWSALSGDLNNVSAMAIAPSAPDRMVAVIWPGGLTDCYVARSTDGGVTWTSVSDGLPPKRRFTDLAIDPNNPDIIFVSVGGFGSPHVYTTTDGGTSWVAASNGLPDVHASKLLILPGLPRAILLGNDFGVYRSTDDGASWQPFDEGLPNVVVSDLAYNPATGVLAAATYGRGMFTMGMACTFAVSPPSASVPAEGGAATFTVTTNPGCSWTATSADWAQVQNIQAAAGSGSVTIVAAANWEGRTRSTSVLIAGWQVGMLQAPSPAPCQIALSHVTQEVPAAGGTVNVLVYSPAGCSWSSTTTAPWIGGTGAGQGHGAVPLVVAANDTGVGRAGTVTIGGGTFTVTQPPSDSAVESCAQEGVTLTSTFYPASVGGTFTATLSAPTNCRWLASSIESWIAFTSPTTGTGDGRVTIRVAPNPTTATRYGWVLLNGGYRLSISQAPGSTCNFVLAPSPSLYGVSGGIGLMQVEAALGCAWVARSGVDWIRLTGTQTGSGPGTVPFQLLPTTTGYDRTGWVEVGTAVARIAQRGSTTVAAITALSPSYAVTGGDAFTLVVRGRNFGGGATVAWNGSARPTIFISQQELRAAITAADIATVGTADVVVQNSGFTTRPAIFTMSYPAPSVTGLTPSEVADDGPAFTLVVHGANFVSGATVLWNGTSRAATFVSPTELHVEVDAADIATPSAVVVGVLNPSPTVSLPSSTVLTVGNLLITTVVSVPWIVRGVAVDSVGDLYFVEYHNTLRIRKLSTATGEVTTVAGHDQSGPGFSGDGLAATGAQLNYPWGVAVDAAGNIYIADTANQRIRKVTAATGVITTMAGTGVAGFTGDGGPATAAQLNDPRAVAVDEEGNVFIADTRNHRVRKVAAGTGVITTMAGTGVAGFTGDGGPATAAQLNGPMGLAVDGAGNLFIADTWNDRIREVTAAAGVIGTVAGALGGSTQDDVLATARVNLSFRQAWLWTRLGISTSPKVGITASTRSPPRRVVSGLLPGRALGGSAATADWPCWRN